MDPSRAFVRNVKRLIVKVLYPFKSYICLSSSLLQSLLFIMFVCLFVFYYMGGFMFHYSWCLQTQTQTSHFYRPFSAISLFKYRHHCVLYTVPIYNLFYVINVDINKNRYRV